MAVPPSKKNADGKGKPPGWTGGPPMPAASAPQDPPLPGEAVDPMTAMMGQVSPSPVPPAPAPFPGQAPPVGIGPGGYGMPPGMMGEPDADDNPMLSALLLGAGGQNSPMGAAPPVGMPGGLMPGDPYSTLPGEPDHAFDGVGTDDPQMGLEQMIQLLMLAKAGVGHNTVMSSSGLVPDPPSNIMMGTDFSGGGQTYGMY